MKFNLPLRIPTASKPIQSPNQINKPDPPTARSSHKHKEDHNNTNTNSFKPLKPGLSNSGENRERFRLTSIFNNSKRDKKEGLETEAVKAPDGSKMQNAAMIAMAAAVPVQVVMSLWEQYQTMNANAVQNEHQIVDKMTH